MQARRVCWSQGDGEIVGRVAVLLVGFWGWVVVFGKVIREHMLGSKEALVYLIEGGDCAMRGEVSAGVCQRKGAVFGDDIIERISRSGVLIWGPEGMKGKFCCELYNAHY